MIDSSLDQLSQLRWTLQPHGYNMKNVAVGVAVVPRIEVDIAIKEDANLDSVPEENLTPLQLRVIQALRQKKVIEPTLKRNKMVFASVKVILTVPPRVNLILQWS